MFHAVFFFAALRVIPLIKCASEVARYASNPLKFNTFSNFAIFRYHAASPAVCGLSPAEPDALPEPEAAP